MNPDSQHLSYEQLADLAETKVVGRPLRGANGAEADWHLAQCSECRGTFDDLVRAMMALRSGELPAPPAYLTDQVLRIFRPAEHSAASLASSLAAGLRSLVAALRFDSGLTPAYGMRNGNREDRQLFFAVDEFDIDVRLALEPPGWRLEGQLLGSETSGRAELTGGAHQYAGEMNELGEFAFHAVAPGSYRLLLALPGVEITVPDLLLTS